LSYIALACTAATPALAIEVDVGNPDVVVHWDNTITYNLGVRAQGVSHLVGDSPSYDESDYKFSKRGDIVTNKLSLVSEFDAIYKENFGLRLSGSGWKDLAYDNNDVRYNPDTVPAGNLGSGSPALPYSALSSYPGGKYSDYTKKYYEQGGQLLDAFGFGKVMVGDSPVYLKIGRVTEYWGNSLFNGTQGISYGQGAVDLQKGFSTPGTQFKELLIPRSQLNATVQLTPDLSLGGQYFLQFKPYQIPEGGTYLGWSDATFNGPSLLQGSVPRASSVMPKNTGDFGLKAQWRPESFDGAELGFYYRRTSEGAPWVLFNWNGFTPDSYKLAYNKKMDMLGMSLDAKFGGLATGFEVSFRHNTGLNSTPNPAVANETQGAKGDSLHVIANAFVPMSRSPLWDTGTALVEVAYTQVLKVAQDGNQSLYNGVGYAGCTNAAGTGGGGASNGCSTRSAVSVGFSVEPQWLQVMPGVDLSMPISDTFGLNGNGGTLATNFQGMHVFSVGLSATAYATQSFKLAYNGYHSKTTGDRLPSANGGYYASGAGLYGLNDRGWVSFTYQTSF